MNYNLDQNEIEKLEGILSNFKMEWEEQIHERATKWRSRFLISFIIVLVVTLSLPSLWWLNIIVISYFAGALFTMLRQRNKTNKQIIEHQKQLKLVRLLRRFQSSPYSK